MKRLFPLLLALLLCLTALPAQAEEIIEPAWPVPDYVTWLLEIASAEVGYKEGAHGYTKFGEWVGDPYAQWCAEYLCWSVDQVDQQHGTALLRNVYPLYSGQNTGKNWFIKQGRYITRNGNLEDWGYQWMQGEDEFITTGTYIPQPGDWVFFTWTSDTNTDHVAMVEYCTRDQNGNVTVHVLEGNNPNQVQRNTYDLTYTRILGYGTVHDVADWTMRSGNSGEKVRQLQEKLIYLGHLPEGSADGVYGAATAEAIRLYQVSKGLRDLGIANIDTQRALNADYALKKYNDPASWVIPDSDEDEWLD
ncbi:MAG: peptidoglycan-binding protein [Clostridia bacterium]|nr:peptidoglycan-binding protein [Clostridia bacterium]